MADLNCPGYNRDVASGTAWDFASESDPSDSQSEAQANADAKAMVAAMTQFALHQCPSACVSIPFVRFGKRNAVLLTTPPEADFRVALAFTEWFLDVACSGTPENSVSGSGVPADHESYISEFLKPHAAGGPPPVKRGDVINDRWMVLGVCETSATEDVRSGEIKILSVTCRGACGDTGRGCHVLQAPKEPKTLGPSKWSLIPDSQGGVTIRRRAEEPFDYYQCVCLSELP